MSFRFPPKSVAHTIRGAVSLVAGVAVLTSAAALALAEGAPGAAGAPADELVILSTSDVDRKSVV